MTRRRSPVPESLRGRTFSRAEAGRLGVTPRQLGGPNYRRVGSGWYVVATPVAASAHRFAEAAAMLPAGAAFSHQSAAELWELPVRPVAELHFTCPAGTFAPRRSGLVVHSALLPAGQVEKLHGIPVTGAERTFVDLAPQLSLREAVVVGDALLHRRLTAPQWLAASVEAVAGRRGVVTLRQALPLLSPLAESPMESRVRHLLHEAGVPAPTLQYEVRFRGRFVARLDFAWPDAHVALEYDGRQHVEPAQLARDTRRHTELATLGWVVIRIAAEDYYRRPEWIVAQVRQTLADGGL